SWGGYRAEMIRFPEQRLTVAVLANYALVDASGLARQVAGVLLEEVLDPAPALEAPGEAGSPADVSGLEGVYIDTDATLAVQVAVEEGKPVLRLSGRAFPLL